MKWQKQQQKDIEQFYQLAGILITSDMEPIGVTLMVMEL
jgi:hypothetical protein